MLPVCLAPGGAPAQVPTTAQDADLTISGDSHQAELDAVTRDI
jgi:hypothetical protein